MLLGQHDLLALARDSQVVILVVMCVIQINEDILIGVMPISELHLALTSFQQILLLRVHDIRVKCLCCSVCHSLQRLLLSRRFNPVVFNLLLLN